LGISVTVLFDKVFKYFLFFTSSSILYTNLLLELFCFKWNIVKYFQNLKVEYLKIFLNFGCYSFFCGLKKN
jgi:hypothetical protein